MMKSHAIGLFLRVLNKAKSKKKRRSGKEKNLKDMNNVRTVSKSIQKSTDNLELNILSWIIIY